MFLSSATLTFIVLESLPYYIRISLIVVLTVRHRPNDQFVRGTNNLFSLKWSPP